MRLLLFAYVCAQVIMLAACSSEPPSLTATAAVSVDSENTSTAAQHGTATHGNHTPYYGGTVYMKGDLHFEVVLDAGGTHHIYFSDAGRAALPASIASEVSLTISRKNAQDEFLRAEVDESGERWVATGRSVTGADVSVRVAFVADGDSYWIDIPFIDASEATPATRE